MPSSRRNNPPDTRTPVYIDILPDISSSSSRSRVPTSSYKPPQSAAAPQPSSNSPRRMRDIDPTVTFVSPSAVIGKSSYIVLLDGAPIHSEDTKLECVGPYFAGSSGDGPLLYGTPLVPKYWETLCKSPGMSCLSLACNKNLIFHPKTPPYTPLFRMCTVLQTHHPPQGPRVAHALSSSSLLSTTSGTLHLYERPRLASHHPWHIKPIQHLSQTTLTLIPACPTPAARFHLNTTPCLRATRTQGCFSRTNTAPKTGWTSHSCWTSAWITFPSMTS
jgi:hypothetical protein